MILKLKRFIGFSEYNLTEKFEPEVTLLIAAYNEKDFIPEKVQNCYELEYPKDKLNIVFVTDGSTDGTPDLLKTYDRITVLHKDGRAGKIGAINRAMEYIKSPVVVFSDANTMFNKEAIRKIANHYQDPKIGAVSGEKRINKQQKDAASSAGEGMYWRYESYIKKLDSDLHSIVGAAGEIFSVRTALFETVEPDTILDDFIISLRIAQRGYRVRYEPKANALENASSSISDELKRKTRICAGGFQSIFRLKDLLNPFKYPILSFQYVSHRVLRWAFNPFALVWLIPINYVLMIQIGGIYTLSFLAQMAFYMAALLGWYFENKKIRYKLLFTPFYFSMMNYSAILGLFRFLRGKQSVLWEKASRG